METGILQTSLSKLAAYIEEEKFMGYDPYDTLLSRLLNFYPVSKSKWIRFGAQQFGKRFPFNLRPLIGVAKGLNPVTLGLCIQGYTARYQMDAPQKDLYARKIEELIDELIRLIPAGYSGACWGYNFDWEARHVKIPAHQPTIVATGIISNALFNWYQVSGSARAFELCKGTATFILNDINRTYDERGNICFSYSPFDKLHVFNASMKGVRTLAQVYSVTKEEGLKTTAGKGAAYVMDNQRGDGAWTYSINAGGWIDNYHTGYILDCMDEYIRCTGDQQYIYRVKQGFHFYRNNFFTPDGIPKFYDRKIYPADSTSAAQSILTLLRFGELALAEKVASWIISNMQSAKGYFYFRKFKTHTIRTSFMRWSNAWMFAALATLMSEINKSPRS